MPPLVKGNTRGVTWGTSASATGACIGQGILVSVTRAKKAQVFEHKNEDNETIAAIHYDHTEELALEVDCGTGTTQPEVGDSITVLGRTGYVQSADLKGSRGAVKTLSITAKFWVNIA
jgi:hypothetical protein